jgi:hypothetical protein
MTYIPTTGPSAIFTPRHLSSESLKPSHFLLFFFLSPPLRFSPPTPIHTRPSAVPAAITPDVESEMHWMNGGERDIPEEGGGEAGSRLDVQ